MRLTKLKMRHRRTRARRNINAFDYAMNIVAWAEWERIGERRGDAPGDVLDRAVREAEVNLARTREPERDVRPRQYAERAITVAGAAREIEAQREIPNWRAMPWFKARALVRDLCGTLPRNKAQAEDLMAELERR
ncbi:MAG: hypothetical protein QF926_08030 [Alphaproteobacteria bacterium]|jgi:hypothetical protein|nr:hypothetical protein [Alphaproteobacteria bacterium]MDP6516554.1 hypothetical protein [Alphaproteobacteria bacterium]